MIMLTAPSMFSVEFFKSNVEHKLISQVAQWPATYKNKFTVYSYLINVFVRLFYFKCPFQGIWIAPKSAIQEVNRLSCLKPSLSFKLALFPFSLQSTVCFISVMIFVWSAHCSQIIPLYQQLGLKMWYCSIDCIMYAIQQRYNYRSLLPLCLSIGEHWTRQAQCKWNQ